MSIVVGIIGIQGAYGRFLERLFIEFGSKVIGSDIKDGPGVLERNREVVRRAQVVVFAVPLFEVNQGDVFRDLLPDSRPDQLWLDVSSVKEVPVRAMEASQAEVVGLHPMCSPTSSTLRGQTVVVCEARLSAWKTWLESFLSWTGARIKRCSSEEHDKEMAFVQCLLHGMQLVMASTMRSYGRDVEKSLDFASPVYRIALSLVGRILRQSPELYCDIQMANPHAPEVLNAAATELLNLSSLVSAGDREEFLAQFRDNQDHLGDGVLGQAFTLFEELSQLLAHRSSDRQVVLKLDGDRPGWLFDVTRIFAEEGINLTHIHSFQAPGGMRFLIGLDRSREDRSVQEALRRVTVSLADEVKS